MQRGQRGYTALGGSPFSNKNYQVFLEFLYYSRKCTLEMGCRTKLKLLTFFWTVVPNESADWSSKYLFTDGQKSPVLTDSSPGYCFKTMGVGVVLLINQEFTESLKMQVSTRNMLQSSAAAVGRKESANESSNLYLPGNCCSGKHPEWAHTVSSLMINLLAAEMNISPFVIVSPNRELKVFALQ